MSSPWLNAANKGVTPLGDPKCSKMAHGPPSPPPVIQPASTRLFALKTACPHFRPDLHFLPLLSFLIHIFLYIYK